MSAEESLPASYFDAVYEANEDPWQFESSAYEAGKYRETIAALGRRHYQHGFEIGCSIGVLSLMLAARCDHLLAVDASEAPLVKARVRARASALPAGRVAFERLQVPDEFPDAKFDLIVMSEVAYYWSPADLERALDQVERSLEPEGALLMVHWTPPVRDYPQRGDTVHAAALARSGAGGALMHRKGFKRDTWRLDLFERR